MFQYVYMYILEWQSTAYYNQPQDDVKVTMVSLLSVLGDCREAPLIEMWTPEVTDSRCRWLDKAVDDEVGCDDIPTSAVKIKFIDVVSVCLHV